MKKTMRIALLALVLAGSFTASFSKTKLMGGGSGPVPLCDPNSDCQVLPPQ